MLHFRPAAGHPRRPARRSLAVLGALTLVMAGAVAGARGAPAGAVRWFHAGLNPGSDPQAIAPGPNGQLWFTDLADRTAIGQIGLRGAIAEHSRGLAPVLSTPMGIAAGPDGAMWFTDSGLPVAAGGRKPAIGRITTSGAITEYRAGMRSGASPAFIAAGGGGLWFTDQGATPAIGRVTVRGAIREYTRGLRPSSRPAFIAAGPDGNLWFTDNGPDPAIGRVTPAGVITEFRAGLAPGSHPQGIAAGPDGALWFADDGQTPSIGRITTGAAIRELAAGPGSIPFAIATGADGNLWFTDGGDQAPGAGMTIGRITPAGAITRFPIGRRSDGSMFYLAPGADGSMWFSGAGLGRIGTGAPAASVRAPSVSGPGRVHARLECGGALWARWAGRRPVPAIPGREASGVQWLLGGRAIAGARARTYVPGGSDRGRRLSCRVTVRYPLLSVSVSATSAPVTVG